MSLTERLTEFAVNAILPAVVIAGLALFGWVVMYRNAPDAASAYRAQATVVSFEHSRVGSGVWTRVEVSGQHEFVILPLSMAQQLQSGDQIDVVVLPCRNGTICGVELARLR